MELLKIQLMRSPKSEILPLRLSFRNASVPISLLPSALCPLPSAFLLITENATYSSRKRQIADFYGCLVS
jgi:hypothetical protein